MRNIFPGLAIICGTALFITGNTWPAIVITSIAVLGAAAGAAITHQRAMEQDKNAKEAMEKLADAIASNATGNDQVAQLSEAFGSFMNLIMTGIDPSPRGGNNGGHGPH